MRFFLVSPHFSGYKCNAQSASDPHHLSSFACNPIYALLQPLSLYNMTSFKKLTSLLPLAILLASYAAAAPIVDVPNVVRRI
jgi:hypothetical protein